MRGSVIPGTPITMKEAAQMFPGRKGGNFSVMTVWRWSKAGIIMPGKGRIILKSWKIGGALWTTKEAVAEFMGALDFSREAIQ